MRDEVYQMFSSTVIPMVKDCMVTKEIAATDNERYDHYDLKLPINKGFTLYYDRNKVRKYKDKIYDLYTKLPREIIRYFYGST